MEKGFETDLTGIRLPALMSFQMILVSLLFVEEFATTFFLALNELLPCWLASLFVFCFLNISFLFIFH
jgi:hypothetical protein